MITRRLLCALGSNGGDGNDDAILTELAVVGEGLRGTILTELGALTSLKELNLGQSKHLVYGCINTTFVVVSV